MQPREFFHFIFIGILCGVICRRVHCGVFFANIGLLQSADPWRTVSIDIQEKTAKIVNARMAGEASTVTVCTPRCPLHMLL